MTVLSPNPHRPQDGVLLRELHHRTANGVASAIDLVSAAVIRAEGAEAKAALSNVVELLHGHAEVHRALATPQGQALIDAATYIRKLGCAMRRSLLDGMEIRLAFAAECLPLQSERCWRLGLVVHDLMVNAAKYAHFDARAGEIKIRLRRSGALVNCVVLDNGSRSPRAASGRRLRISHELAKSLGGRVEQGFGSEFTSVVLSFPLTERERQANCGIATRRMGLRRSLKSRAADSAALCAPTGRSHQASPPVAAKPDPKPSHTHRDEVVSPCKPPDVLGELLSPSHRMDAL